MPLSTSFNTSRKKPNGTSATQLRVRHFRSGYRINITRTVL
jgi:hypothetical protein